jgi:predicted O-linked N-acetylglucosamine transferase (SPINDLY family)
VARAHDRKRVTVVGYGTGPQRWEQNAMLNGAFDTWHDISTLDPATLARFFERGGLHLIVDAAGFSAPRALMALARVRTAIRVSWLGNSAELGRPVYDARIAPTSGEGGVLPLWQIAGGYPVLPVWNKTRSRSTDKRVHFGADVQMAQLDDETVALWTYALHALPDAKLLLRAHDMGPGGNIDRLIIRFGRELSARIDIVKDKELEAFYADIDVALTPCRGVSPRAAAEAVAHGVPPVAFGVGGIARPYSVFLSDLGLGPLLVAADGQEYASIAVALATSEETRRRVAGAMTAAVGQHGIVRFAQMVEKHATDALALVEGTPHE